MQSFAEDGNGFDGGNALYTLLIGNIGGGDGGDGGAGGQFELS